MLEDSKDEFFKWLMQTYDKAEIAPKKVLGELSDELIVGLLSLQSRGLVSVTDVVHENFYVLVCIAVCWFEQISGI